MALSLPLRIGHVWGVWRVLALRLYYLYQGTRIRGSPGSIDGLPLSIAAGLPSVGGGIGSVHRLAIHRRMVRSVTPTSWHRSGVEYSSWSKGPERGRMRGRIATG